MGTRILIFLGWTLVFGYRDAIRFVLEFSQSFNGGATLFLMSFTLLVSSSMLIYLFFSLLFQFVFASFPSSLMRPAMDCQTSRSFYGVHFDGVATLYRLHNIICVT